MHGSADVGLNVKGGGIGGMHGTAAVRWQSVASCAASRR